MHKTILMKTVFSGIQPSGNLHIGNYFGSIANWTNLQQDHKCLFGIMDLHAITVKQDPKELQKNILDCAILYLASGIDPKKSIIFTQSQVKEHAELAWILSCFMPLGWLNRMTQFKEKSLKSGAQNLGLYAYPTLMAADILLYKSNLVPTGEDQKQHLELTRDIAFTINSSFKQDFLTLPDPLIIGESKRVMSLNDGTSKMSKSNESEYSRINLSDTPEIILKKCKKAKTDSLQGISYDKERVELFNLINILATCENQKPENIAKKYQDSGFGDFKTALANSLINKIEPIQKNIKELNNNLDYVTEILKTGQEQAQEIASKNLQEIKKVIGLA
jgi:tryptophanyl-tRNA synthetase